jgi:hypothetical protein
MKIGDEVKLTIDAQKKLCNGKAWEREYLQRVKNCTGVVVGFGIASSLHKVLWFGASFDVLHHERELRKVSS